MRRRELIAGGLAAAPALLGGRAFAARSGGPVALVTADQEAHVAVVALGGGRVRRRIATRADPRSIEAGARGPAVVGHSGEGAVSLIDRSELRVRRVLGGFQTPRYTAIAPDARLAYVTDGGTGELAVLDLVRGRVLRRVEVGAAARHLGLSPDGRTLWIALGSTAATIVVVSLADPEHPRVTRRIAPPFGVHDVAFSPSGRRVWVTAGRERRLAVYTASGERPLRVLDAADAPQHVSFDHARAFVTSGDGRSLRVHELSDGRVRRDARVPLGSYNVLRRAGVVVTPSLALGTLTILDPAGRELRRVPVARAAHDVTILG